MHTGEGGARPSDYNSQILAAALELTLAFTYLFLHCISVMVDPNIDSAAHQESLHLPSALTHIPYLHCIHPYWAPFSPKKGAMIPVGSILPLKPSFLFRNFAPISISSVFY